MGFPILVRLTYLYWIKGPGALWSQYTIWLVRKWCNSCSDLIELHFFYRSAIACPSYTNVCSKPRPASWSHTPGICQGVNAIDGTPMHQHWSSIWLYWPLHWSSITLAQPAIIAQRYEGHMIQYIQGLCEKKFFQTATLDDTMDFPNGWHSPPTELYIDMHPVRGMPDSLRPMSYIIITTKDESRVLWYTSDIQVIIWRKFTPSAHKFTPSARCWCLNFLEKLGQYHTCRYTGYWCCQSISNQ